MCGRLPCQASLDKPSPLERQDGGGPRQGGDGRSGVPFVTMPHAAHSRLGGGEEEAR